MKRSYKFKSRLLKFLIGIVFLLVVGISSLDVVFAEQDISTLMDQWFDQKKSEALVSVQSSVSSEKEAQMVRLKQHLQSEMERAEKEMQLFEEEQIRISVKNLREHTEHLISTIKIDNAAEKQAAINRLHQIYNEAVLEMGSVELMDSPQEEETNMEIGSESNETSSEEQSSSTKEPAQLSEETTESEPVLGEGAE